MASLKEAKERIRKHVSLPFLRTLILVGLERRDNVSIPRDYAAFYYIYDPTMPFDFDVPDRIKITSDTYENVYIVPDKKQYEKFLEWSGYKTIKWFSRIKEVNTTITAKKGWGIIIWANNGKANVEVVLDYYP